MKKKFIKKLAVVLSVTLSLSSFPYNVLANTNNLDNDVTNIVNPNSSLSSDSNKNMKTNYIEDSSIYTNSKDIGIIKSTYKGKSPSDFINLAFVQNFETNLHNYLVEYENNIAFINIYNSARDKSIKNIPITKSELIIEGENSYILLGENDGLSKLINIEGFNKFTKENREFIVEVDYLVDNNKLQNNTSNINLNFSSNLVNIDSKDYLIYEFNYDEEKILNDDNKLHIYFSNNLENRENLKTHYIIKIGESIQHVYINNGKLSLGKSINNLYFKEVKKLSDYNISLELLDDIKIPKDTKIEIYKTNNGIDEDICFMKIYNGLSDDNVKSYFEFSENGLKYYFFYKNQGKININYHMKFDDRNNNIVLSRYENKNKWGVLTSDKRFFKFPLNATYRTANIIIDLNRINPDTNVEVLSYNVLSNYELERVEKYDTFLRFENLSQNKNNNKLLTIENSKETSSIIFDKNSNIIKLDANGGHFSNNKSEIIIEKIKLNTIENPLKPKMIFLGWSKEKDATEPDAEIFSKLDDLSTIYAVWRKDEKEESKDDTQTENQEIIEEILDTNNEEIYQNKSWDDYLVSEQKENVFTQYVQVYVPKETSQEPQRKNNKNKNYIKGYEDGTFRPENSITRAEAASMISRINGYITNEINKETENWYDESMQIMTSRDLIFPDENGDLRPNEAITRGEFVRALYHIDEKNEKISPFNDIKGHKYEKAINQAFGNNRISGYPDGTFKPDEEITRAEVVIILNKYANIEVNKNNKNIFKDLEENHWAYYDILSAVSE